jgi:hypothetical protein
MGQVSFFKEKQRTVMLHDYLVFICGVDVSAFVESLDVAYTDRSGPGSVDIVLSNPFDQWMLNLQNLAGSFRNTSDRYSEKAKYQIYQAKKRLSKQLSITGANAAAAQFLEDGPDGLVDLNPNVTPAAIQLAAASDFQERYGFGPGSCIFSRFDTVRVFLKNPFDAPDTDRWLPFFCGTTTVHPMASDYVNGRSTVSIQAYDIRAIMAAMRVAVNPYNIFSFAGAASTAGQTASSRTALFNSAAAGFFKDIYPNGGVQRAGNTDNIFAGLSFVDMVSMVITGRTNWVSPASNLVTTLPPTDPNEGGLPGIVNGQGIGFFVPGQVFRYGNSKNTSINDPNPVVTDLEAWDFLCLFGVSRTTNKPFNRFLTEHECNIIGKDSFWTGKHTPLNGQMHFLLPAKGLQISDMVRSSFNGINNIMGSPDWTNRYQLVTQVCQQVDYEWSVTGMGDIIFEFPMYDFFPSNFGANKNIYTVNMHAIRDNISDEGGEVLSALESQSTSSDFVKGGVDETLNALAQGLATEEDKRAVAYSNVLASRYGAIVQSVTFAGVTSRKALQQLTTIEFQKRIAEINKLNLEFSYRPFLRPNRPLLHQEKNRIGKIIAVRYSLPNFQQEPTVSITLGTVRLPILVKDPVSGKQSIQYTHINGGPSMSLSYNAIFEDPTLVGNSAASGIINQTPNNPTTAGT